MENDVLYNRIMNVIHEEYGEGSTAVANPEGEPTDDLTSIRIGDEIYGISGGGSSDNFYEVHCNEWTLDKTWKEINDALSAGKQPFFTLVEEEDGKVFTTRFICSGTTKEDGSSTYNTLFYTASFHDNSSYIDCYLFEANSENAYPAFDY